MRFLILVASFAAALTLAGCFEGPKGDPGPPGVQVLKVRKARKARRAIPGEMRSLRRSQRRNNGAENLTA